MLIFVQSIERAEELYGELKFDSIRVGVIHSNLSQEQVIFSCSSIYMVKLAFFGNQ
jgi:glutamyl-tRNA reductase